MLDYVIEMLECPACHGTLAWNIIDRNESHFETAEAHCAACGTSYPAREGIGAFLTPDLIRSDLWGQRESGLAKHLREYPDVERQLMDVPIEGLAPADQFLRAEVLDLRGDYAQAKSAVELALPRVYAPEVVSCMKSQMDFVLQRLEAAENPIVDLASGMGTLVEETARKLDSPIIATDFSPSVLSRDRRRWESFGLYDRISLLAFDARRTPFKNGAIETLTTYQGLPNIRAPGDLLQELRRVVAGKFPAVSNFYPEDDEINSEQIRSAQMETLLYRTKALTCFAEAGWHVEIENTCSAKARPTPSSVLIEGTGIDGMPVTDTEIEFCLLNAETSRR